MLKRQSEATALWLCTVLVAAAGCGVQPHPIGGGPPVGQGAAGVTGAAGAASGAAGASTGFAGDPNGTGVAGSSGAAGTGVTGAAGDGGGTGAAGTTGAAGAAGSSVPSGGAGNVAPTGAAGTAATGAAGTGVLSGVTVNIGGTNVPKENAIAFIHFGHSNMAGRGRNPAGSKAYHFTETDPHAWMYHSTAFAPYIGGAKTGFELATEPKTAGDRFTTRTPSNLAAGPGTTLVKQAAALAPGKYFISLGYGVGSVFCTEYMPGGLYYDQVVTAAKELKGKVTFAAIVILLGITERHGTAADIQNYPKCINDLATAIRTDVGELNLPVLINGYEMGSTRDLAPTSTFAKAIIPRIAELADRTKNPLVAVIPTDNPLIPIESEPNDPDGDHHFTLDGHKEYMRRLLQAMKDRGWWRW